MRWVATMALMAATAMAQGNGNGGGSDYGGFVDPLIMDLESYLADGDTMLIIMGSPADMPPPPPPPGPGFRPPGGPRPSICGGLPALMTKSSTGDGNGACMPGVNTSLSCSCITELEGTSHWEFRVTAPRNDSSQRPTTIPANSVLEISAILIFVVPSTLVSFKLSAESAIALPLKILTPPGPDAGSRLPALVRAPFKNALETIEISNIALGGLPLKSGFLPPGIQNLALRNCNLTRLTSEFLGEFGDLASLDVSGNQLLGVYQDVTASECSVSTCALTSLNLSNNAVSQFPSYLLNLDKLDSLDLSSNPIRNSTVDSTTIDALTRLKTFKMDSPAHDSCGNGSWRQVRETRLCIAAPVTTESEEAKSSNNAYVMYGSIGGGLLIAVLLFIYYKRSAWLRRSSADKDMRESLFDSTLQFDESHPTVSASLLNDPIIITNRIPYKDLRVANCISKGGFGLVYSGVYNRRRVAIKKIRPDRAGDIKQIESFLKEICLIATLNHPRVVEFIGVSWDSLRNLCAVTEFMERGDLREVLHGFKLRNTPLTWESHKTTIALHIAEGLTYLHSLSPKVIHRDLKSKNVLLNGEMHAKLSDFGISRERHLEETHMTAGIGTSFWIAPEVLLGKDYDERADIFSFGVVLSEIDTDDYPYWNASNPNVGNKAQENMILQMVASGAMRPSFSDSCPPAVLELADLCLQLDPENRPTAAEVAYELQRIISALSPVAHVDFSTSGF